MEPMVGVCEADTWHRQLAMPAMQHRSSRATSRATATGRSCGTLMGHEPQL